MADREGITRWMWAGEAIFKGDDIRLGHNEMAYRARPGDPSIGRATHNCPSGHKVLIEVKE
jgi:hypothetical protein